MTYVVAVTGGRYYADRAHVYRVLDGIYAQHSDMMIVHGACPVGNGGADILAEDWAKSRQVPYKGIPAKFRKTPKYAGPLRNWEMLTSEHPDLLVAFPGGSGTNGCVAIAAKLIIAIRDERG